MLMPRRPADWPGCPLLACKERLPHHAPRCDDVGDAGLQVPLVDAFAESGPGSAAAAGAAFSTAFRISPPLTAYPSTSDRKSTSSASGVRDGCIWTRQICSRSTGPGISNSTCVRMWRSNAGSKFAARFVANMTTPLYYSNSCRRTLTTVSTPAGNRDRPRSIDARQSRPPRRRAARRPLRVRPGRLRPHFSASHPCLERKLIEQVFGWMKTIGGLRKLRHRAVSSSIGSFGTDFGALKLATAENCAKRGDSQKSIEKRTSSISEEAAAWLAMLDAWSDRVPVLGLSRVRVPRQRGRDQPGSEGRAHCWQPCPGGLRSD
jgi:hypothetical protein